MKKIYYEYQTPKKQVSGSTVTPEQIKKNLGVILTKSQKILFDAIVLGVDDFGVFHTRVKESLVFKNLARWQNDKLILTEKGKAYAKIRKVG